MIDLSFFHRDSAANPIVVKDADEIHDCGVWGFWKGLLIALPVSLLIWGFLFLLFGAF
jgi:hypothetical protein